MTYYLIDYENVGEAGLKGIADLNEEDYIIIFYSENAGRISFDLHRMLNESTACVEYRKVKSGMKNALDFQLATYLGYLIAKHDGNTSYYIISKDNGYDVVKSFWKDQNIFLSSNLTCKTNRPEEDMVRERFEDLEAEQPKDGLLALQELSRVKKELSKIYGDTAFRDELLLFLEKYKNLQDLNNALVRWYGSDQAYEIYKKVKPLLRRSGGKRH